MKVDLHTHTAEHSGCCPIPALDMVRTARDRGLDGVVISDHHYHLTARERDALERAVPGIRVFRGAEIGILSAGRGGLHEEDLVVVSDVSCTHLDPVDAADPSRLVEYVRQTGALVILAHPFRYHPGIVFDLDRFTPDAVEIASTNVDGKEHDRVAEMAREHGMQVVAASDAHRTAEAALFSVDLDDEVTTERELAEAIRRGAFTLGGHEPTLRSRIEMIGPDEQLARRVVAEGGLVDDYLTQGGLHAAFYYRVADGGSYLPNVRALGLRNPTAA